MRYSNKKSRVRIINRGVTHEALSATEVRNEAIEDCIACLTDLRNDTIIDTLSPYEALDAGIKTIKLLVDGK